MIRLEMARLVDLMERVKAALGVTTEPDEWHWTPPLEPFDENEPPIREADHTSDDPGPKTLSHGEIRPFDPDDDG
jgi:hypothetical protein